MEVADGLQIEAIEPAGGPLRQPGETVQGTAADAPAILADGELRIFIHFQGGSPAAARANELSSSLAAAKDAPEVELRNVTYTIATPRIRYFYADDADAATALAALLDPANDGSSWQVQDFTHFRPGPAEGTLEVFVASSGG